MLLKFLAVSVTTSVGFAGNFFFVLARLFTHFKMAWALLSPSSKSSTVLSGEKSLMVGYPSTFNSSANAACASASTLATMTFSSGPNTLPSSSQSGASCLQCPHHGA